MTGANDENVSISEVVKPSLLPWDLQGAYQLKTLCNSIFGVYLPLLVEIFGAFGSVVAFIVLLNVQDTKNPFNFLLRALTGQY